MSLKAEKWEVVFLIAAPIVCVVVVGFLIDLLTR